VNKPPVRRSSFLPEQGRWLSTSHTPAEVPSGHKEALAAVECSETRRRPLIVLIDKTNTVGLRQLGPYGPYLPHDLFMTNRV
jgi:hypothetical protein